MDFVPIVRVESNKPEIIDESSELYAKDNIKIFSYLSLVGKNDLYIPGVLTLKQNDLKEEMEWLLWIKARFDLFLEMNEDLSGPQSKLLGQVDSSILFYENTKNLEVVLQFGLDEKELKYPDVIILNNHNELFHDFQNGLNKEKYLQWQYKLAGKEYK